MKYYTEAEVEGLRKIRLYHWDLALYYRKCEQEYDAMAEVIHAEYKCEGKLRMKDAKRHAKHFRQLANKHLGMVQSLNCFFTMPGDTAERDAAQKSAQEASQ